MRKFTPEFASEDMRGSIYDLSAQPVDAVTIVKSRKGAVRGNHYHKATAQWAHVVSGLLLVQTDRQSMVVNRGETVVNEPGEPHAWRALTDTVCVVWVRGPRAGHNYESDTYRLEEPILS